MLPKKRKILYIALLPPNKLSIKACLLYTLIFFFQIYLFKLQITGAYE